jgi:hypothetical protein
MPKTKQQKQKERQRRIAREKHDAATQKRTEAKTTQENKKLSRTARVMTAAAPPKTEYVASKSKTAFVHRRTGG